MKHQSMIKALIAVVIMLMTVAPANAQLGNLGKIAKSKVEGTAQSVAKKAKDKGEKKAREKMWEMIKKQVLGGSQMPELPWVMDEGVVKSYSTPVPDSEKEKNITWYVTNLDKIPGDEVKDLKAKLDARYNCNKKILMAQEAGLFSQLGGYTNSLLSEVEKEQERWQDFYNEISQFITVHCVQGGKMTKSVQDDKMTKKDVGNWNLTWDAGQIVVDGHRRMLYVARNKSGKLQFYSFTTGQGTYAEEDDIVEITKHKAIVQRLRILLEGLTTEGDSKYAKGDDCNQLEKDHAKCNIWLSLVYEANENNSPDNIQKSPMPKAGKLNASLKAKALAIAKEDDSSVIDVVITSNNWEVKPLERRIVTGYIIRKDKNGKLACERSWCQDYMGGGKYGSLRHYGVGLRTFYIQ